MATAPVGFNDGMGGWGVRRPLETPEATSLYIECLGPMGQVVGRATGFMVRRRDRTPLLITNRHVVTARDSLNGNKLRKRKDGSEFIAPSALRVAMPCTKRIGLWEPCVFELWNEEEQPAWLEHPTLGWEVDVIALPMDLDEERYDVTPVPLTPCPVRLQTGSKLFVVGFPAAFDPFTAPGAVGVWTGATMAWPPELGWRDRPLMLLDGRTREGQSGSPTWFVADRFTNYLASDGKMKSGPEQGLVGVYAGRIAEDSDIGYVWKRSALEAIVECGVRPTRPLVSPFEPSVRYERLADPQAIREDRVKQEEAAVRASQEVAEEAEKDAREQFEAKVSSMARRIAIEEIKKSQSTDACGA